MTIYAVTIDPTIEARISVRAPTPRAIPDAEVVVDIAAHETNEAMSDPEGTGYMNPNGWEIGDMCEFGPQDGPPLGSATDGSPYNQVINGHQYLIQEMWSNAGGDQPKRRYAELRSGHAEQPEPAAAAAGPPDAVQLDRERQHREQHGDGTGTVTVTLYRSVDANGNPVELTHGTGAIGTDGSWTVSLAPYAVGDDRRRAGRRLLRVGSAARHGRSGRRPRGDPHRQWRQPVHRVRLDRLDRPGQRHRS